MSVICSRPKGMFKDCTLRINSGLNLVNGIPTSLIYTVMCKYYPSCKYFLASVYNISPDVAKRECLAVLIFLTFCCVKVNWKCLVLQWKYQVCGIFLSRHTRQSITLQRAWKQCCREHGILGQYICTYRWTYKLILTLGWQSRICNTGQHIQGVCICSCWCSYWRTRPLLVLRNQILLKLRRYEVRCFLSVFLSLICSCSDILIHVQHLRQFACLKFVL